MNICGLDYTERAMQAEKRLRRGERQLHCGTCGLWRWPEECEHEDRLSAQRFRALLRAAERQWPSAGHLP